MSQSVAHELAKANESYVQNFGDRGNLPLPPGRKVAVITCMDARINPYESLGLKEGEAHVIRNAGGRAHDALRSVIISQQLLGTKEIVVFHHTDCGMLTFNDEALRSKLKDGVPAEHRAAIAPVIENFSFLPFSDINESVNVDVAYLKAHPLVAEKNVSGYVYDVRTGKISKVA